MIEIRRIRGGFIRRASLFCLCCCWLVGVARNICADQPAVSQQGEVLYNGIRLPAQWPPRREFVPTREPMPAPYLYEIPDVIPIDVGRQLFVDDFLIEPSTLKRTYHEAEYYPINPILKPDRSWENGPKSQGFPAPTAMVFSDGVWYDPADALFKMWYMGGYCKSTCYATSKDGIHWKKPSLDVVPGTNIVHTAGRDSGTVWLDLTEKDPQRRYKMFLYTLPEKSGALSIFFSPDGIHWSDRVARTGPTGDRSTVFYNPFRNVWVYSIRASYFDRRRRYQENHNLLAGAHWKRRDEPTLWVGADRLDPRRPEIDVFPQLYNLDAVAYESLMLGLFTIWRGQPTDRAKPNDVCVAFSRDGFHWRRPCRRPLVGVSEHYGDWNWANVQSAGGCCLVVKDKLYFYVSGRAGVRGSKASGVCSTGLAVLRRDGFASMDAGKAEARLTTRLVRFTGKSLFVNVDAPDGELRVAVLDKNREPIKPFTRDNCIPIQKDTTLQQVCWKNGSDLSTFAGKPVRFCFYLRNGSLYSFWVSPDQSGASYGYVAAGGPGFTGPIDTVGAKAY